MAQACDANRNPVGWVEIPVTDKDRAKKFYDAVFGFSLSWNHMNGYDMAFFPMLETAPGATGTLITGQGYQPSRNGTVVYFSVADIEATLAKAKKNGGKTIIPKKSIGQHGFIGWFEDSEGNTIALHSMT